MHSYCMDLKQQKKTITCSLSQTLKDPTIAFLAALSVRSHIRFCVSVAKTQYVGQALQPTPHWCQLSLVASGSKVERSAKYLLFLLSAASLSFLSSLTHYSFPPFIPPSFCLLPPLPLPLPLPPSILPAYSPPSVTPLHPSLHSASPQILPSSPASFTSTFRETSSVAFLQSWVT